MPKRLPPQLAWPVKSSVVATALGPIAAAVKVAWITWQRKPSATVLQVTWAPGEPAVIGGLPCGGAAVWVSPVAREEAEAVRALVADQVLPEARAWLEQALTAGQAWQASRRERRWLVVGGKVEHHDRDGVATLREPGRR